VTTNPLILTLASEESLDVRDFTVDEALSRPFDVQVTAVSRSVDVDFEAAIGKSARFEIQRASSVDGDTRYFTGICASIRLLEVEEHGLSTYAVRLVPELWLLTERRNYRIFQDLSELDIALEILAGWGIRPTLRLDASSYEKRRMRTQYAETDFDFVNRLLEEIGVTYFFDQAGGASVMVLSDTPSYARARPSVPFIDRPSQLILHDYVTAVQTGRDVRPGKFTQSDVDYRKPPGYPLAASASGGNGVEAQLERYHHEYGSFLWKTAAGGDTPFADDRGAARTNERGGATQVQKRLDAQRVTARGASFRTTAHDLRPGVVFTISGHPRRELAAPLLVESSHWTGHAADGSWTHALEARYTDVDYRPPTRTPKPRALGIESATVTGPAGETIHTDEFGRVRVRFHWDRTGPTDERSSCWIPVSQPWAGAGFGGISLCRVGQEVIVDFLGGDPDRPVVLGRVFTTTTPPPYKLPKFKMVSGHRSDTYTAPPGSNGSSSGSGG
jgi:type VI secretion system secreted protein VgrG